MTHVDLVLEGLHCAACVGRTESALAAVRGERVAAGALGRALRRMPKFLGLTLVSLPLLGQIGRAHV